MEYRAVCFDMDGVIVDSERHWVPIENERILPAAVPVGDVTASEITGMNVSDQYGYLSERYDVSLGRSEFIELYDAVAEELYTERVALMDGFCALARSLRARARGVALVSSSPQRWIRLVLDRFQLHDAFDQVVSGAAIDGPSKPAPDVYERAVSLLGVAPEQCIAVEDSEHGIEAATSAGMYCVGYRSGGEETQDLSAADAVVNEPGVLDDHLAARLS